MKRYTPILIVAVISCISLTASIGGCVTEDTIRQQMTDLQNALDVSRQNTARLEAQLAALPPAGTGTATEEALRTNIESSLGVATAKTEGIEAALAIGNGALAEYERQKASPIGQLAALAPEPWRTGILGFGAIGTMWYRERRLKGAASEIVKSIDLVVKRDPAAAEVFADPTNAVILDAAKGKLATKLVKAAKEKPIEPSS